MSDYDELVNIGKRSDEDEFIPSLIQMIENIHSLVNEADEMTKLAVEGDLDHRGDPSRFRGEYAKVISGFNQTLDAVIEPIQATSAALNELAKGNLNFTMDGEFKGQHGQIQDDMNRTIDFLKKNMLVKLPRPFNKSVKVTSVRKLKPIITAILLPSNLLLMVSPHV